MEYYYFFLNIYLKNFVSICFSFVIDIWKNMGYSGTSNEKYSKNEEKTDFLYKNS